MGAIVGPNIGLSEIGSRIVRKIADNADTGLVSKSTEEVLNKFEMFNKRRPQSNPKLKKLIIASMDVEKYYPNIISDKSAKIIRKMWEKSELSIEGIDFDKLSKYLGKHLNQEEIMEEKFEEILYRRKVKNRKQRKTVTKKIGKKYTKNKPKYKRTLDMDNEATKRDSNDVDTKKNNDSSMGDDTLDTAVINEERNKKKKTTTEWIKPMRNPTTKEQRKMFGKALELLLTTCMDNHVYQFGNKVRLQQNGGPIGLKLTGEIADCLMIDWDMKLLTELKKYRLIPEVYTRFKDDIEIVIESLEKGSRIEGDKIVVDEKKKGEDESKCDSKTTMEIVHKIANSINPMIKLTVETPCNLKKKKLPVLDVMVNINVEENNRIDFEFFEKPTKNPKVILANSALSFCKKRTILTKIMSNLCTEVETGTMKKDNYQKPRRN